jgi:hypothetical protein
MSVASKDYRYSVEFNIHGLDAPGTRLIKNGDIYINICLLNTHKRTRIMPPYLPMHIDQKLYFDKVNFLKNFLEKIFLSRFLNSVTILMMSSIDLDVRY